MPKTPEAKTAEGSTPKSPEGDFWYVPNAGLIVLHPFIAPYFEHLKLLKDQSFIHKKAQTRAVHLLHWLATGEEQAPEYDLMLPKLLAGWPVDAPLRRAARLADTEKTEGLEMLQTVVRYWGRLGTTSPDGLREGFLRRPGKLAYPGPWRLQMEQSTLDILLQGLPWGIGVVKLPWMPEMLYVEWNY
jgi:hypothetical protein